MNSVIKKPIEVNFESIKNVFFDFLDLPNWILWDTLPEENNRTKLSKRPSHHKYRGVFDWQNPENRLDFEQVKDFYKQGNFSGIGLVITKDLNLICLDMDNCLDDNSKPSRLSQEVNDYLTKAFIEKSVSGNGLHFWFLEKGKSQNFSFEEYGSVEIFCSDRFVCVTGVEFTFGE